MREAADEIRAQHPHLGLLVNKAGVMTIPYGLSEDGFELTFATNHLGHFALTGLILDQLLAAPGSRVVTVSSIAHRRAETDLDAIETGHEYDPGRAYESLETRQPALHPRASASASSPGSCGKDDLARRSPGSSPN